LVWSYNTLVHRRGRIPAHPRWFERSLQHELLEQLYAGGRAALVSAKQLGLPVAAAHLQAGSLAPRLVTRKRDKNDVKKRATSSRALDFFE
jgi:hypothetical protein